MTLSVSESIQFSIEDLIIVSKGGNVDIKDIYEEISIHDSIFSSTTHGSVLIRDAVGLSNRLLFDGTEAILITIKKSKDSDLLQYKKSFRIYKQTDRRNINQTTENYVLHFVSDELMFSDQQRINQGYEETYTNIVRRIMIDYLKIPKNSLGGIYEDSLGIKKVVIPNLRPLEAIEWCSKRSVDVRQSPTFLFYENVTGFNYVTLSTLLRQPHIIDIDLTPKNMTSQNQFQELSGARNFEILSQSDSIEKARAGVNAGKFIGFDPLTRTYATRNLAFGDHYTSIKHSENTPNFTSTTNRAGIKNIEAYDTKVSLSLYGTSRQYSNYIKAKDPTSISKVEDYENQIFQRRASFTHLLSKKLRIVMPGNFQLTTGFNVNVKGPVLGEKETGVENEDLTYSGKYLIIASRQLIKPESHETIIEVASSSSKTGFIADASKKISNEVMNY